MKLLKELCEASGPPGFEDAIRDIYRREIGKLAVERTRSSGFDPYARVGVGPAAQPNKKAPVKRDLRKLGEWIKMKRELEARKSSGDDSE